MAQTSNQQPAPLTCFHIGAICVALAGLYYGVKFGGQFGVGGAILGGLLGLPLGFIAGFFITILILLLLYCIFNPLDALGNVTVWLHGVFSKVFRRSKMNWWG